MYDDELWWTFCGILLKPWHLLQIKVVSLRPFGFAPTSNEVKGLKSSRCGFTVVQNGRALCAFAVSYSCCNQIRNVINPFSSCPCCILSAKWTFSFLDLFYVWVCGVSINIRLCELLIGYSNRTGLLLHWILHCVDSLHYWQQQLSHCQYAQLQCNCSNFQQSSNTTGKELKQNL